MFPPGDCMLFDESDTVLAGLYSVAVLTVILTLIPIPALLTATTVMVYVVLLLRSRNVFVKPVVTMMLFFKSVCSSDDITTW